MNKNIKNKRLLSFLIIFAMTVQMFIHVPKVSAYESEFGNFLVSSEEELSGVSYDSSVLTISAAGTYTVGMKESVTTTSDRIEVTTADEVNLTINGLNISTDAGAPILLSGGGTTNVTLSGTNTLTASSTSTSYAGLQLSNKSSLVVTKESDGGSLEATGTKDAAGIGGAHRERTSTVDQISGSIYLYGGEIKATGADNGAGIGLGHLDYESFGTHSIGEIVIDGADVTATGGQNGSGIGSGAVDGCATIDRIVVNSGSVIAEGGSCGAGIGHGDMTGYGCQLNSIDINGGVVVATGKVGGAGIGAGRHGWSGSSTVAQINFRGGQITATGGDNGAGVGCSGEEYSADTSVSVGEIHIEHCDLTAKGGSNGAGIGTGYSEYTGQKLTSIEILSGVVKAEGGDNGAGIGSGKTDKSATVGDISIGGGTVTAIGGSGATAGIGAGVTATDTLTLGIISIDGGTVTATSTSGVGIGSSTSGTGVSFSTGDEGGNAFIVASSISDTSNQSSWNGAIIIGSSGKVYGETVTLSEDAEVPASKTLNINSGSTLALDYGITLTNKGTITGDSTIETAGELLIGNGIYESSGTTELATETDVGIKYDYSRTIEPPVMKATTDTTIELEAIDVLERGTVYYGYLEDADGDGSSVTNWQTGTLFENLTENTTYYFYSKVEEYDDGDGRVYSAAVSASATAIEARESFKVSISDSNWDAVEYGNTGKTVTYKVEVGESERDSLTSLEAALGGDANFTIQDNIQLADIKATGESTFTIAFASDVLASEAGYTTTLTVTPEGDGISIQTYTEDIKQVVTKKELGTDVFIFTAPADENDRKADNILTWYGGSYSAEVTLDESQGISNDEIGTITVYYRKEGQTDWTKGGVDGVGKYYVAIDISGGDNYASLEKLSDEEHWIFEIQSGVSIISDLSKEYDGEPVTDPDYLTDVKKDEIENVTIKFYKYNESTLEEMNSEKPKDVGKYQVAITITTSENYETITATQDFEITRVTLIIDVIDYTGDKVYDGKPIEELTKEKCVVTTLSGKVVSNLTPTITYRKIDSDSSTSDYSKIKDAGVYVIEIVVEESDNYSQATYKKYVTISKGEITVTIDSEKVKSKEYDGAQKFLEEGSYTIESNGTDLMKVDEVKNEVKNNVTIWYKSANADDSEYDLVAPRNAGTYKVKVSVNESSNYGSGSDEVVFSITQAIGTIKVLNAEELSKTYDGEEIADPICDTPMKGLPKFSYKKAGPDEEYSSEKPKDAGTYLLKVEMVDAGGNYTDAEAIVDIVITKANIILEISADWNKENLLTADNVKIIGTEGELSSLKNALKIEYKLATEKDDAYSENWPTVAGDYIVRVSLEESDNYSSTMTILDFSKEAQKGTLKIYKRSGEQVTEAITLEKTYDGLSIDQLFFSQYIVDTEGTGTAKYEYRLQSGSDDDYTTEAPVNKGEYYIRISLVPAKGYKSPDPIVCSVTVNVATGSLSIYGWN